MQEILDSPTPEGYDPKKYIVLIKEAMKNARNADKSKGWFPEHGTTKIYELVESLMKFVSYKEFDSFVAKVKAAKMAGKNK